MNFYPRVQPKIPAAQMGVLFTAFAVPLCFSIHLEDGFELSQAALLLWSLTLLMFFSSGDSWKMPSRQTWLIYGSFGLFWILGFASFLGLRREVFFYLPSQNYLWVLGGGLLFCPAVRNLPKRKLYFFLVLAGVLGSFYSFAQAFGLDLSGWSTNFAGRSFSTMGNPIFWAGYLLVVIPLAIHLAWSATEWKRGAGIAAVGILVLSLLTTQTRGAWIGFGVEIIVVFFFSGRKKETLRFLIGGAIAALVIFNLSGTLKQRALSIFSIRGEDAQGRYFMWKVAEQQWEGAKWFGLGPGGYAAFYHETQSQLSQMDPLRPYWSPYHAHNEYLEFLAERGLIGCFFGLIFAGGLFWLRWKGAKEEGPSFGGSAAELAVLSGFAVHSLFHFPFSIVPVASSIALLMNPYWGNPNGFPEVIKRPGGYIRWMGPAIGVLLLAACLLSLDCLQRNAKLHQSIDALAQGKPDQALGLLDFPDEEKGLHYWDPRVSIQKAFALGALGRLEEASQNLRRELQVYPFDADAEAALCMFLGRQKRWEEAQSAGERALQIAPSHPEALNNLAVLFYLQGRKKEAVGCLSRLESAQRAWSQGDKADETERKIKALS